MSVPVNWEKKRVRTDSNKAIADRRPNLFESRSLFNYNLVQCLYLELILNVDIYLLVFLWYLELIFKWGHRRNFESTKSVSKRFSTFEIEFC